MGLFNWSSRPARHFQKIKDEQVALWTEAIHLEIFQHQAFFERQCGAAMKDHDDLILRAADHDHYGLQGRDPKAAPVVTVPADEIACTTN